MTTILDIPFECLPVYTVAELARTCKNGAALARASFEKRDFYWDMYQYLQTLEELNMIARVYQCITEEDIWGMIEAVLRKCSYVHGCKTLVLPPDGPIRVHVQVVQSFPLQKFMTSSFITIDFHEAIPILYNASHGVSFLVSQVVHTIHNNIHNIATTGCTFLSSVEWSASIPSMFMLNARTKGIFVTPYLTIQNNFKEECEIVYDGNDDYAVRLRRAMYVLLSLKYC